MNRVIILFILIFAGGVSNAQTPGNTTLNRVADSLITADSLPVKDSSVLSISDTTIIKKRVLPDSTRPVQPIATFQVMPLGWSPLASHPGFIFKTTETEKYFSSKKIVNGKEILFYLMTFLLIIFATLKNTFPKYFNDLFRFFFRRTLNQKQVREQLMQTPLPSLLLNVFFVISEGLYLSFLLQHFKIITPERFWIMFLYTCTGLSIAYFIKFTGLKICGWLFNMEEAASSYVFVIFIINKMLAILLIPFLFVIAFSTGEIYSYGILFSWFLVAFVLIYRFILTFSIVRNEVKVNLFHFFLYIAAFEVSPVLLVYKALLIYFNQTA